MNLLLATVINTNNNLRKTVWLSDYSEQDREKIISFYKQSKTFSIEVIKLGE